MRHKLATFLATPAAAVLAFALVIACYAGARLLPATPSSLDGAPMQAGSPHTADIVVVGTHADAKGMLVAYRRPGLPNYGDTLNMLRLDHWVPLQTGVRGRLTATAVRAHGSVQEYAFRSWKNADVATSESCDNNCWARLGAKFEAPSAAPSN